MTLKRISTDSIRHKFQAVVFPGFSDNLKTRHCIGKSAKKPATLFDHYQHRGLQFVDFLLFDYMKLVTVVTERKTHDVPFSQHHLYADFMFQRPLDLQSLCRILVSLVGFFSTNKVAEDAVPNAYIETNARQNNMGLILLALFVP